MRCQLRASKNEIEHLKSEGFSDPETKDKQTKVLHETIRNLQTHLLSNRQREMEFQNRINSLEGRLKKANVKELLLKTKIAGAANPKNSRDSVSTKGSDTEDSFEKPLEKADFEKSEKVQHESDDEDCVEVIEPAPTAVAATNDLETIDCDDDVKEVKEITEDLLPSGLEAKLVSLSTAFLMIQPTKYGPGVSLAALWAYIHQFLASAQPDQVTQVLKKHRELFAQDDDSGHWRFVGFEVTKPEVNGEIKN